jgi:ubiquinone/menaquinone biosynthesis C-methylase UbiE
LPLVEGGTVLDLACGRGKWGYLLRSNWWSTKNGRGDEEPELLVGLDVFLPFLRKMKYHRVYDDVVHSDATCLPFRNGVFDTVLASEVIEHMDRDLGRLLLKEIERVAKKVVIVTTPNFMRRRGGLNTPEGFNPYEKHVARWGMRELKDVGYNVRGVGFLPLALFPSLNAIFSPLSTALPILSTHIVATKIVK